MFAPFLIVSEHQHQQHSHQCGQTYQSHRLGASAPVCGRVKPLRL